MSARIIIIGAGIGGLCLAQGLKLSGLNVLVYERDRHPTDRLQGYRLHISTEGSQALENCLPPLVSKCIWNPPSPLSQ
jgi:2-polyprenyl-6-methoxyphenol hydroxylase-like FAD-dependent oxidoreductase